MATANLPPAPSRPSAPPPVAKPSAAKSISNPRRDIKVSSGIVKRPLKCVIYGPGGVGKTELAANLIQCGVKPLFIDLEGGSHYCDVVRDDTISTWEELRGTLQNESLLESFNAVVVDSLTKAEELATTWTVANVPHEKGHAVSSIEGYGFGKGQTHVYETFLQVLADLDSLIRRNMHVICVAHDCTANAPNPGGDDWIRYEPRLQSPQSGKASIRHKVREWCDHLFFVGFDVVVSKDGKGSGSGSRAIYSSELPTHWAKSRLISDPIVYERGSSELWQQLLNMKG